MTLVGREGGALFRASGWGPMGYEGRISWGVSGTVLAGNASAQRDAAAAAARAACAAIKEPGSTILRAEEPAAARAAGSVASLPILVACRGVRDMGREGWVPLGSSVDGGGEGGGRQLGSRG